VLERSAGKKATQQEETYKINGQGMIFTIIRMVIIIQKIINTMAITPSKASVARP